MMFQVQYGFDTKTQQFTATIPELNNISDFGETIEEAECNIAKAAELYLEELESLPMSVKNQTVRSYIYINPVRHDQARPA